MFATETSETPPQPPPHDFSSLKTPLPILLQPPLSPTTPAAMQRSKTVRNFGHAGNKVREFFKKQTSKDVDHPSRPVSLYEEPNSYSSAHPQKGRPPLPSSASYTPRTQYEHESFAAIDEETLPRDNTEERMETRHSHSIDGPQPEKWDSRIDTKSLSPEADEVMRELEQVNASIARVKQDVAVQAEKKKTLQSKLEEARRLFQAREVEYTQVEHNFFEHTRVIRATDDDLSTIRDSFKLLKYSITRMIMTLNKKADRDKATEKLVAAWPHLSLLDPTTTPQALEPKYINLLVEKRIHEHLVQSVFRCPLYPGLSVNEAYASLNEWLVAHESRFNVRLRQQLASIVAKNRKEGVMYEAGHAEKKKIADRIYNDLADIYAPFVRENDAAVEEEKRYSHKIADIVDKAMQLVVAIRGQEVDIATLEIEEGKQAFDEETMVDVKGKTAGTVLFCICPVFVGGDGEHGFLEKGKVVVGGV